MITARDLPHQIIKSHQSRNCYGLITILFRRKGDGRPAGQGHLTEGSWGYINRKYFLSLLKWNNKNSVLRFLLFQRCIMKSKIVDQKNKKDQNETFLKFGFVILPIYKDSFSCP